MAERRDYLLRMIEQMGAVFARIRQLIAGGSATAELEMREAAKRAGVDLTMARALEPESLIDLLSATGEADPTRTWLFAEFLFLESLAMEAAGDDDDAIDGFRKALRLYAAIDPRIIGGIPEARDRVAGIERRLAGPLVPPPHD